MKNSKIVKRYLKRFSVQQFETTTFFLTQITI